MFHLYIVIVLLIIKKAQTNNVTITSELLALGLSSGAQIALTSGYTQRWSTYDAPEFVTAVKPATDADVAKIVQTLLSRFFVCFRNGANT